MVVTNIIKDVYELVAEVGTLDLPILKQNGLKIDFGIDDHVQTVFSVSEPPLPFANSQVFKACISNSKRLSALEGDCKAIFEITFDVTDSNFEFRAGDTIGIIPHNDESDVNQIITDLDLMSKADVPYTLSVDSKLKAKVPAHIPIKSTLRHVLTNCVDLRSVLKKLFLLALSKYTKDEIEKKIMEYFCSKQGSAAYTNYILNTNMCLLDIFAIFKSCKPPIEIILNNLPRLLPRPYSIVNSGLKNSDEIKICFSVMEINNRKGLTTGWLEKMILRESSLEKQMEKLSIVNGNSEKVSIYLRKNLSQFSMPASLETPLILIGPGTGVAPFIGFLEEREHHKRILDLNLGNVWLFFGCRNPKLDFIYEDELNGFLDRGILTQIRTAFSRMDNDIKYVQDALLKNCEEVTKLLKAGASVFICGDLKSMATQMKETLVKCIMEHDSMSKEDAETVIADMQKDKRYLVDAWS